MDTKEIKEAIGRCRSRTSLNDIVAACRARDEELRKREHEQLACAIEKSWLSAKGSKAGHVAVAFKAAEVLIYVAEAGKRQTILKPVSLAAGAMLQVRSVQPRAKRVWFLNETTGESYGMEPPDLGRLEIAVFPDELTAHVAMAQSGLLSKVAA